MYSILFGPFNTYTDSETKYLKFWSQGFEIFNDILEILMHVHIRYVRFRYFKFLVSRIITTSRGDRAKLDEN